MPGVFRAGARPAAATCLLACLLAACSGPATDAAAPAQTGEAKPLRSLGCLPTSLVSLELPLREGFAYAHGAPRSDAHVGRCVLSMFGPRTLKSPLAFDRAYRRVFAYHEEDGTTDLRGLAPEGLQLFRIGSTSAADVWLLRADTGTELPSGRPGLLEARVAPIGPDWIRTTDIASIDSDGFVTLHGRADGAINRGGFKVQPEDVRRVLISHPAVRDACVVGVPDARLGQVPFAAIEVEPGHATPADEELKDLVRQQLPVYTVPVAFAAVDELPRNPALKVSLPAVAALYPGG